MVNVFESFINILYSLLYDVGDIEVDKNNLYTD